MHDETRWKQRLTRYRKAYELLVRMNAKAGKELPLDEEGTLAVIKAYEIVFELSWNVMKDFLSWQGYADIAGSRDAIRGAFRAGLLQDGEGWMSMIGSRNTLAHVYDDANANDLVATIRTRYLPLFEAFLKEMESRG